MPTIMRRRSLVSLLAVVAMVAGLMVIPVTAGAAVVDTSATCPSSIPAAGFTDIGGVQADAVTAINCIAFYKITTGTTATTYSPNNQVTRWQMALFLTRQATVHGVTLPSGADQGFTDLTGIQADAVTAINQLKQLGITTGTTATTFNPNGVVNRWQMALFLSRLVTAAGVTLPATPVGGGFTDLTGVQADAAKAINQLFDVGITTGTTATTFNPNGNVNRWQMALFLARTAAADNVAPTGLGNFIWAVDTVANTYKVADAAACGSTTVTYASSDKFFIDGTSATLAAFEAALNAADFVGGTNNVTVVTGTGSHTITTGVLVTSGVAGAAVFATGEFWFIEPVSGNILSKYVPNQTYTIFTVGGVTTSKQVFLDDLSVGDTVAVTGGNGTTAAKVRTYALTNGTLSGTVGADVGAGVLLPIDVDTDCATYTVNSGDPATDTFTYSVDGTSGTELVFNTAATSNDQITYSRSAKKTAFVLTNQASAPYTGKASTITPTSVTIAKSSTSSLVVDWTTPATLRVNGAVADVTDFADAVSLGDTLTYQADNPATTTDESSLVLTDALFSGKPKTPFADPLIILAINGVDSETVSVNDTAPADLQLATVGTGSVKYSTNGSAASNTAAARSAFVGAVNAIIAGTFTNGNVSVAQVGNDIVWSVTTS